MRPASSSPSPPLKRKRERVVNEKVNEKTKQRAKKKVRRSQQK